MVLFYQIKIFARPFHRRKCSYELSFRYGKVILFVLFNYFANYSEIMRKLSVLFMQEIVYKAFHIFVRMKAGRKVERPWFMVFSVDIFIFMKRFSWRNSIEV